MEFLSTLFYDTTHKVMNTILEICVEMIGAEGKVILHPSDSDPPKVSTFIQ